MNVSKKLNVRNNNLVNRDMDHVISINKSQNSYFRRNNGSQAIKSSLIVYRYHMIRIANLIN